MTTPFDLQDDVVGRLSGIPEVKVYSGYVPESVPTIPGTNPPQIKPYLAVWPGAAQDTPELPLAHYHQGFRWTFNVTVVARNAGEVLRVAHFVRLALHGADGPGGSTYTQVENGGRIGVDPDPDLKPSRSYIPLEFVATTTH